LFGVPIQLQSCAGDTALMEESRPAKASAISPFGILHRLQHAFAEESLFIAVSQLHGLVVRR